MLPVAAMSAVEAIVMKARDSPSVVWMSKL
jgi:hypothetical protein